MSMTWEETSKILMDMLPGPIVPPVYPGSQKQEAIRAALIALRGPTREMVERIWFREPYTRLETRQGEDGSIVYSAANTCMACGHETPIGNFCHNCGAAQTVEGVELTMKRLEALKDGKGD